jgi:hypothetical protein
MKSSITSKARICSLKDGDGGGGVGGVELWTHYVVVLLLLGTSLRACAGEIGREKANKQTAEKTVQHVLCVQITSQEVVTTNDVYYSFPLLLLWNGS